MPRGSQLFYITHIDNIPSILQKGILSHSIIENQEVKYTQIYDKGIISNRKDKKTPNNKSLWEYANIYFHPRNPMLYRVVHEQPPEKIAILAIDKDVTQLPGVFITNGNAASLLSDIMPMTQQNYYRVINQLKKVFDSTYWTDEDGSKRKIMAECLVPKKVPSDYIKTIYVVDDKTADEIKQKISYRISVVTEPKMFFSNPLIVQLAPNLSVFKGDMFFSKMHTLTISVNIVGIMGKGLASRAKYQFPDVYVRYQDLCRKKILRMGKPFLYKKETSLDYILADESGTLKNDNGATWFLLFPTKRHWRENADLTAIEQGMQWLKENYKKEQIKSIAIPALGCGLGKLDWKDVGPMLCNYLKTFDIPIQLYIPSERKIPEEYLKKEFLLRLV